MACQENYGGITKNCGDLRTQVLSSSWLIRKITEESQKTEHISVPTCFRALGLSQSLRRTHKKLSISPYQPAYESLACQDRYGENAKNRAYLRTYLLSGPWLIAIATEESQIIEHTSVPTCFQALGLSGSLRRKRKKLSIPPYPSCAGQKFQAFLQLERSPSP